MSRLHGSALAAGQTVNRLKTASADSSLTSSGKLHYVAANIADITHPIHTASKQQSFVVVHYNSTTRFPSGFPSSEAHPAALCTVARWWIFACCSLGANDDRIQPRLHIFIACTFSLTFTVRHDSTSGSDVNTAGRGVQCRED